MKEVVFTETLNLYDEPFTTSEVIAEFAEVQHKAVQYLVKTHMKRLEKFGVLTFQMSKPQKGTKGGRPKKVYLLNEEQATLLITFLDNTDVVADFKAELVHQFYAMKTELLQRQLVRESGKNKRRDLTDAIKDSEALSGSWHDYSNFTRLIYRTALGYDAGAIRKARKANPKATPLDFLTSDELTAVNKRQDQVTTLIDLGMNYQGVKAMLNNNGIIYQTTLNIPELVK